MTVIPAGSGRAVPPGGAGSPGAGMPPSSPAIANVIAFLAGDLAAPVSGAIIPAYGA